MSSASTLPTELIQSILLQTDPETYLSAHQTCRSWRHASLTPYMLRHTLQQIPASLTPPLPSWPPSSSSTRQTETETETKAKAKANTNTKTTTDTLTPEQWTAYFAQVARLNLLSRRRHVRKSVCKVRDPYHGGAGEAQAPLRPSPSSIVQARSEDGRTVAVLRGAKVLVFRARATHPLGSDPGAESENDSEDESHDEGEGEVEVEEEEKEEEGEFTLSHEFPLASSLYPHWTSVCRGLMDQSIDANASWSGNRRYSKNRVAVSSRGGFVAVALGRVIQVYALSPPHGSRGQGQGQNQKDLDLDPPESIQQRPAEYVLGQNTEHIAFARVSDPTAYEDTDGVVEGLEFVDNDTLLRVVIGKESTIHRPTRVRYLGCPDAVTDRPDLRYWRDAVKKVYLDSAALGVSFTRGEGGGGRCDLRGLRLLGRDVVDVRGQWEEEEEGEEEEETHPRSTSRPTTANKQDHRYFVASIQTGSIDTYCIGRATSQSPSSSSPVTIQLIRLLPSIYSRPSSIIPITPQTKEYPCLYAYPHRPDTTTQPSPQAQTHSESQSPPPSEITKRITHSYNLQTTLPRFTSTNLPSGTFSSPHLAVSSDYQILVIYEPDHACCVVEGGALYVCHVGSCRSVYQPASGSEIHESLCVGGGEVNLDSGSSSDLNAERGGDEQEGRGGREQPCPRRDIIPTWPFLLDRVGVNVECLKVKKVRGSSSSKYKVTGIAGGEEVEWLF